MAWYHSNRRVKEFACNIVLAAVVLLSWGYVILAGRTVSERYLSRLDLTQFQDDRGVPQFWQKLKEQ